MELDYLFEDKETGEIFFVEESKGKTAALKTARKYFNKPVLLDTMTPEQADILGYDTY